MTESHDRLNELRIERQEEPAAPKRTALAVLTLVLLAVAGAAGWWLTRSRPATVKVATVTGDRADAAPGGALAVLDATGYVVARLRATVSSKITGKIVEVLVEEGMAVAKGQVLARLDDATVRRQLALSGAELDAARRALEETRVRLEEAELSLRRTRALVESQVLSQAALDRDQAAVDALRARLDLGDDQVRVAEERVAVNRQMLDDTVIRAPFDGVAVTKDAQPGEMISPTSAGGGFTRTGVCTVVDMASLEIEVDVNEAYINRVSDGQRVQAVLDAYPDWRIPGYVITTVPTADRQRATVRVRIAFDQLDPRMLPDMGIKVSFLDAEAPAADPAQPAAPRLWAPAAAIREDGDGAFAWLLADGVVRRRAVTVGRRDGARLEVASGLTAGDRVVVDGPETLADGDAVTVP